MVRFAGEAEFGLSHLNRKSRTPVALAAGILLAVQAFASALAIGSSPVTPLVDAFGNPLCITGSHAGGDQDNRTNVLDCCSFGCGPSAPLVPSQVGNELDPGFLLLPAEPFRAREAQNRPRHSRHDPGNPRAPPLLA
jgi:hypothetical protein